MGSTRLPGKVLKDVDGLPMLMRLYQRCKAANLVDKFVISTADNDENQVLKEFAEKNGIEYYAGSEDDLLDRIYQTGKKFGARAIVRITGDCPLIEPKEIDRIVKYYLDNNEEHDYVSNNFKPTLPDGLDTEIIKFSTIEQVWKDVQEKFWRELALSYIFENPDKYKIQNLEHEQDLSYLRWTVDYPEDFMFIEHVFKKLGNDFKMEDVLELIEKNPEIGQINKAHNDRDKAYHDSLKEMGFESKRDVKINTPKSILVIGAGSIGERHINNLKEIYSGEILIYEANSERATFICKTYDVKNVTLEEGLKSCDTVLICTGTDSHLELLTKVLKNDCNVFVEKPVSHSIKSIKKVLKLQKDKVVHIGYNLRFEKGINLIKEKIESGSLGKTLSCRAKFTSYLPLRHPERDYRDEYVCKKIGGGVALDVSHEIDYLYYLFGAVKEIKSFSKKISDLEMQAEDNVDALIQFKNGVIANVHLDFLTMPYQRHLEITASNATLFWDFSAKKININYNDKKSEEIIYHEDINKSYLNELRAFLTEINTSKKTNACDLNQGIEVLKIIDTIKK